jgi:CBS domain-containing membrane protein
MAEEPMPSEEPIGDKPTPNVSSRDERPSRVDRLRLPYLLGRYPSRLVWAAFLLVNGFLTIGLLASVAMISGTPLVFPSLGPTALLLFHNPMQPAASPRNTLCGHAIGILCGYASLWLMGLTHDPPTIVEGVHAERVFCAALSLASTGAVMVLLNVWHPPAGATTLIIALGIITRPYHLLIVEAAVAILVLQALIINRLAGIEYPVWARAVPVGQREPIAAEGRPEDENLHRTKRCT